MDEKMLARFEAALANGALTGLVRELEVEGRVQVEIYDCFEQFRALLRELDREADEDRVMDTMDCIIGWCSSHAKLFSHYLTNDEIEAYRQQQRNVTAGQEPER